MTVALRVVETDEKPVVLMAKLKVVLKGDDEAFSWVVWLVGRKGNSMV